MEDDVFREYPKDFGTPASTEHSGQVQHNFHTCLDN